MKCTNCGAELNEIDVYCPKCGAKVSKENANMGDQNVTSPQTNYSNQNNNYQNYSQNLSKGITIKSILIALVLIIVVAMVIYLGVMVYSSAEEEKDSNSKSSSLSSSSLNDNTVSATTTSSVDSTLSSSYKVNFQGFTLYIPDNLIYQNSSSSELYIYDEDMTWVACLVIMETPFQQIKQNENFIKSYLLEQYSSYNPSMSDPYDETVNGVDYIIYEFSAGGTNEILAIAQLNSMYSVCLEICNEDNDFSVDALTNISTIISNTQYTGTSNYLQSDSNIDMSKLGSAIEENIQGDSEE